MPTNIADTPPAAWLTCSAADIAVAAAHAIEKYASGPRQIGLARLVLSNSKLFRAEAAGNFIPSIHLPLLIYAAVRDTEVPARSLAVALTLLETGIYTLDHIVDNELTPPLAALPPTQLLLTATNFLCVLPQRALCDLDVDSQMIVTLQQMLAEGMGRISEGQLGDMASTHAATPVPEEIEAVIGGKTGERRALYAALAAKLAGATQAQSIAYAGYAHALGVARQLHSDLIDLFGPSPSRDLASGTRTLPLAFYLAEQTDERRSEMLVLLDSARRDLAAQTEICERLRNAGTLRRALLRTEGYCQRALRLLADAQPSEPARHYLEAAASELSMAHENR